MNFKPCCLATGIGSVPHTDPEEAVKFVVNFFPEIPYWPQLPLRGSQEGFLNQFIAPLVKLGLVQTKGKKYFLNTEQQEWGARLAEFYEIYMAAVEGDEQALDYFAFPQDSASGFYSFIKYLELNGTGKAKYLKGQISGPLTVGLALTDQDMRAVYYNPQGRDVLIKTLALQGISQVKTLSRFGLPVIVFVDDPGLYASGQSAFITLKKQEIMEELNSIYDAVKGSGALAGTHSCSGMDWSILFESKVDIVSFDAFEYFVSVSSYTEEMKTFLNRGGCLAWGIVPTSIDSIKEQTIGTLEKRMEDHIEHLVKKGIDGSTLFQQGLVTPACGTGTLPLELAEKVHDLTMRFAGKLRGNC